jgi:hypothetical protein
MKGIYKMKKILFSTIVVILEFGFSYFNKDISISNYDTPIDTNYCRAVDLPKQDISKDEESELKYMREEEKMAHDFYVVMYEKWGLRPFNNISKAEQRHMSVVKSMLDKYLIDDPVKNIGTGIFTNSEIKSLYENLLEQGNKSAIDALKAGAEIEEVDIADLMEAINNTDNKDLKLVYNNIMNGSYNHLRAFVRVLDRRGVKYEPKHLDKNLFDEILNK